jgi:hypothetical protein
MTLYENLENDQCGELIVVHCDALVVAVSLWIMGELNLRADFLPSRTVYIGYSLVNKLSKLSKKSSERTRTMLLLYQPALTGGNQCLPKSLSSVSLCAIRSKRHAGHGYRDDE